MSRPATKRFRRRHLTAREKLAIAEAFLAGDDRAIIIERFELTSVRSLEWIVSHMIMEVAGRERRLAVARRRAREGAPA